jgi:hypothetical protein
VLHCSPRSQSHSGGAVPPASPGPGRLAPAPSPLTRRTPKAHWEIEVNVFDRLFFFWGAAFAPWDPPTKAVHLCPFRRTCVAPFTPPWWSQARRGAALGHHARCPRPSPRCARCMRQELAVFFACVSWGEEACPCHAIFDGFCPCPLSCPTSARECGTASHCASSHPLPASSSPYHTIPATAGTFGARLSTTIPLDSRQGLDPLDPLDPLDCPVRFSMLVM